ncbi:hypothetical protein Ddye_021495 [Dipteronia dyeriana]|uniref:Reverse transcriptase domain-containing protein n=1 Tax=Dipteronia dyeriana TaxID=168575 RepID=A0AAD9U2S3_9ROSI|nr:hypothetical protein Ddye_021495 [Dipteronia dyeriana]
MLGGLGLEDVNQTLIVLISKVKQGESVTDFCPISLCNVNYKIVKSLVNRLRTVLDDVISVTQSAFIPRGLISDNAIIGFECMHALKHWKKGKKGVLALKLDMSKAYDRVVWDFISGMMTKLGFSEAWVDRILRCVKSISFSYMINGDVCSFVKPSRGLR